MFSENTLGNNSYSQTPIEIKPGMGFLIITDKGPTGICGQSMDITCPHCRILIWPDEQSMRDAVADKGTKYRSGSQHNFFMGVFGEWSTGSVQVTQFTEN